MEFWWIVAFSLISAAEAHRLTAHTQGLFDHTIVWSYVSALVVGTVLLFRFISAGRVASFVLLGVLAIDHWTQLFAAPSPHLIGLLLHAVFPLTCIWLMVYLQNASTVRLCAAPLFATARGAGTPPQTAGSAK